MSKETKPLECAYRICLIVSDFLGNVITTNEGDITSDLDYKEMADRYILWFETQVRKEAK